MNISQLIQITIESQIIKIVVCPHKILGPLVIVPLDLEFNRMVILLKVTIWELRSKRKHLLNIHFVLNLLKYKNYEPRPKLPGSSIKKDVGRSMV